MLVTRPRRLCLLVIVFSFNTLFRKSPCFPEENFLLLSDNTGVPPHQFFFIKYRVYHGFVKAHFNFLAYSESLCSSVFFPAAFYLALPLALGAPRR